MIRAVIDVNVLVSALLAPRGTPRQILVFWQEHRFTSVTSEGIIAEVGVKLGTTESAAPMTLPKRKFTG